MYQITLTIGNRVKVKTVSRIGLPAAVDLCRKEVGKRFPNADRRYPENTLGVTLYFVNDVQVASISYQAI